MLRLFGFRNEFVYGLPGEKLVGQVPAPCNEIGIRPLIFAKRPICCFWAFLPLGGAAYHLFDFALFGAARVIPLLFRRLFFAGRPLGFFAFFLAQCFGVCHSSYPEIKIIVSAVRLKAGLPA